MAKHSSPTSVNWGPVALVSLVVLLLVVGGISVFQLLGGSDDDGATAGETPTTDVAGASGPGPDEEEQTSEPAGRGDLDCTPVTVWSAPELLPAVQAASERAGDECFSYAVVSREAATAQAALRSGETPDVWVAGSSGWPELMAAEGVDLEVGDVVASSPVVLAASEPAARALGALGVSEDTTFGQLTALYREAVASGEAPVTLRVGDPRVDQASMALLAAAGAGPDGWAQAGSDARGTLVLLAQTAVQGDPLVAVAADPTTVVPVTQQQVAGADPDLGIRGLPFGDGASVVRMPFVRIGDAGSPQAADALEEALTSEDAAGDIEDLGLQPGDADGQEPDPEITQTLARTWTVIAPQSRILTLIDISGSMEAVVGEDTTRIDLTRQAAQTALSVVPGQTAIGLWYFATALDGKNDYRDVVRLRPLNEVVRSGVTQKDLLLAETDKLDLDILEGDTGLHDSLWAAYTAMQERYSPEAISSVLLLTDGINDDSTGGLSEKQVVERLSKARDSGDAPVTVVLIGVGPDVDAKALDRLAKAAGGESLVIRDPRELPQVFVDVVASRAP
ncbi:substrate-binding domain-containing protein [Ornithinimicrobium avium]|uniref:substrate-binding domain-containing protein n=1 Tax=Ornithinimicrobium avium TaxID=2283195 RepID=UPI0013B3D8EB|nr:substrate-binding domain-containing protein [Ornithinimicrobium avium]